MLVAALATCKEAREPCLVTARADQPLPRFNVLLRQGNLKSTPDATAPTTLPEWKGGSHHEIGPALSFRDVPQLFNQLVEILILGKKQRDVECAFVGQPSCVESNPKVHALLPANPPKGHLPTLLTCQAPSAITIVPRPHLYTGLATVLAQTTHPVGVKFRFNFSVDNASVVTHFLQLPPPRLADSIDHGRQVEGRSPHAERVLQRVRKILSVDEGDHSWLIRSWAQVDGSYGFERSRINSRS